MSLKMIAIIRIKGDLHLDRDIRETLYRLKIRRKFACVVLEPTKENLGMIKKVKDFIAFGNIDDKTYEDLVKKRGVKVNGKLKPFFRLHPPRGGMDSKMHFRETRKGVLGDNKEGINDLIRRML